MTPGGLAAGFNGDGRGGGRVGHGASPRLRRRCPGAALRRSLAAPRRGAERDDGWSCQESAPFTTQTTCHCRARRAALSLAALNPRASVAAARLGSLPHPPFQLYELRGNRTPKAGADVRLFDGKWNVNANANVNLNVNMNENENEENENVNVNVNVNAALGR